LTYAEAREGHAASADGLEGKVARGRLGLFGYVIDAVVNRAS